MEKPRKQTYTLSMYLQKMRDRDIRDDQKVQRLTGQWSNAMMNELIFSVLNDEYVPPIILGQEASSQLYIVDGLQRSTVLMMFRYGGYRITSSLEEPVISYRAKVLDAEGEPKIDGNGDIIWETNIFDLRHKTYEKLPEELKKTFDEYQLDCIIHENYNQEQISRLVRRYNHLKPMNVSQRAFTFVDKFARQIREILKRKFFIECTGYTKNERKNGTMERVVMESVMCMFHFSDWKKSGQIGQYMNENASPEEFNSLENNIARLENIVTDDLYSLFTSKDSFIWFTIFHRFTKLGVDDRRFTEFLGYFMEITKDKELNEFFGLEKNCPTKDKSVILKKLDKLETLMHEYLGIPAMESESEAESEPDASSILEFVRENAAPCATNEDIDLYKEVLDTLSRKLDASSVLLEEANKPSLMALVAYSFENDIDLDDWFVDFAARNDTYIIDQKKNYIHMKENLKQFIGHAHAA